MNNWFCEVLQIITTLMSAFYYADDADGLLELVVSELLELVMSEINMPNRSRSIPFADIVGASSIMIQGHVAFACFGTNAIAQTNMARRRCNPKPVKGLATRV